MAKTLVTLTKDDPSIYVTIPISEDDCVGNSLPFINWNFRSIDNVLSNITFSANNFWNDSLEQINNTIELWNDVTSEFITFKAEYEQLLSTIEELSSDWFSPISVVYPFTVDTTSLPTVSAWVQSNFPINPFSVTDPLCYEYIEGQILNVFVFEVSGTTDIRIDKISGLEFEVNGTNWVYTNPLSGY